LSLIAASLHQWVSQQAALTRRVARVEAQAIAAHANAPERLMLLQRYQGKLERAIDKKLRALKA
jgi:hypothetical protein